MQVPSVPHLLTVWETGAGQSLPQRALLLLAAIASEPDWDDLEALSVGQRNVRLLALRERLFGRELAGFALCPACGEQLELNLSVDDLRAYIEDAAAVDDLCVAVEGYQVAFRLPTSRDLLALDASDFVAARQPLLQRCLLTVGHGGQVAPASEYPVAELPATVVAVIETQMDQADPAANIEIALTCPICDHEWLVLFDIVSFLWHEIETWAVDMLQDIHTLASVYGWCEGEILAMSPTRRQRYVQMILG